MSGRYALVLFAILLLGTGFWVGRCSSPEGERLENLTKSLSELEQNEIQEYRELKGQSEKLKKAEEILGKVMSLFLIDLGIRFKREETPPIYTPPKEREAEIKAEAPPLETPASNSPTPSLVEGAQSAAQKGPSAAAQKVDLEKEGAASILAKNVRGDFGSLLNDSFRPGKEDVLFSKLNGKYSGLVTVINPSASWVLNFEVNGKLAANRYSGNASLRLFDGPKRIAWRTERNSISMLRKSGSANPWLVLEISEAYYAEMLFQEADHSFAGNFYEKKGPNQFLHRGTLILNQIE